MGTEGPRSGAVVGRISRRVLMLRGVSLGERLNPLFFLSGVCCLDLEIHSLPPPPPSLLRRRFSWLAHGAEPTQIRLASAPLSALTLVGVARCTSSIPLAAAGKHTDPT